MEGLAGRGECGFPAEAGGATPPGRRREAGRRRGFLALRQGGRPCCGPSVASRWWLRRGQWAWVIPWRRSAWLFFAVALGSLRSLSVCSNSYSLPSGDVLGRFVRLSGRVGGEGGGACRSVLVEPSRAAAGFTRAKGMVVWVWRLATELDGAASGAVLVGTTVFGGGAAVKNDVIVRCPSRRTTLARTLFQAASWCLSLCRGAASPQRPIPA